MSRPVTGILLVDKPVGPTSSDVVQRLRRRLVAPTGRRHRRGRPQDRVGHAGTLDPLASGLLLVLVGKGTRLGPLLLGLDKEYTAVVRLGVQSSTLDRDGDVTAAAPVPPEPGGLEAALASLRGTVSQVPPVFSALKRDGEALHRRMRRGEEVAAPQPRPVRIDHLTTVAVRWGVDPASAVEAASEGDPRAGAESEGPRLPDLPPAPDGRVYEVVLHLRCGSGTYVRSLAHDLAAALGTVGHLHDLRRLAVGPFRVESAAALAALAADSHPETHVLPLADALPHLPAVRLDPEQAFRLRGSGTVEPDWLADQSGTGPDSLLKLLAPAGDLAAVVRQDPVTGLWRPIAVFPATVAAEDDP